MTGIITMLTSLTLPTFSSSAMMQILQYVRTAEDAVSWMNKKSSESSRTPGSKDTDSAPL